MDTHTHTHLGMKQEIRLWCRCRLDMDIQWKGHYFKCAYVWVYANHWPLTDILWRWSAAETDFEIRSTWTKKSNNEHFLRVRIGFVLHHKQRIVARVTRLISFNRLLSSSSSCCLPEIDFYHFGPKASLSLNCAKRSWDKRKAISPPMSQTVVKTVPN